MNCAVEMDSGVTLYILSFIKIGSGIQKLLEGIRMQASRQQGDLISPHLFFSK
jgi:hypothetical protein